MSNFSDYKTYVSMMKVNEHSANEVAKKALLEGAAEVFEAHPVLLAFGWRQHSPNNNDGDPTPFSVDDVAIQYSGDKNDSGEEGDFDWISDNTGFNGQKNSTKAGKAYKAVRELMSHFPDNILEKQFGSDSEIIVTREGKLVEEDYYSY